MKSRQDVKLPSYRYPEKSGDESDYESDGGTTYRPSKSNRHIGAGTYCYVRKFLSSDEKKEVAVAAPSFDNPVDFGEAARKKAFLETLYPDSRFVFFKRYHVSLTYKNTYRLVMPIIKGISYGSYSKDFRLTNNEQINLFCSAVNALEDCHQKGYVVVDLKADNIHYDLESSKSYLLDGGTSAKINNPLCNTFQNAEMVKMGWAYFHIAPECWSVDPVKAETSMDVYSFGNVINHVASKQIMSDQLMSLARSCLQKNPSERPTLPQLAEKLNSLRKK